MTYALTPAGRDWTDKITEENSTSRSRWVAAMAVGKQVEAVAGWNLLRDLAYAEPTFVSCRQKGYGQALRVDMSRGGSAAQLLDTIRMVLANRWPDIHPTPEVVLKIFFEYLQRYSKIAPVSVLTAQVEERVT